MNEDSIYVKPVKMMFLSMTLAVITIVLIPTCTKSWTVIIPLICGIGTVVSAVVTAVLFRDVYNSFNGS